MQSAEPKLALRVQHAVCAAVAMGAPLKIVAFLNDLTQEALQRSLRSDPRFARNFERARGRRARLAAAERCPLGRSRRRKSAAVAASPDR